MVLDYDTRPDATIDEKVRSLKDSIQLALNELGIDANNTSTSQGHDISSVEAEVRALREAVVSLSSVVTGFDTRIETLEEGAGTIDERLTAVEESVTDLESAFPDAPAEDGAYKLTVTVTDGIPVYTWESA